MGSRAWIFTNNHPESNEIEWPEFIRFAAWQLERGEQGTPHHQGYVQLVGPQRLTAMKKILPRAHWEVRRGTHEQALAYATKTDTREAGPWYYGEATTQGKRKNMDDIAKKIKEGTTIKEIASEFPVEFIRYHKGFKALKLELAPERSWKTQATVLYGPTGCGKSYFCNNLPGTTFWLADLSGQWWDGYDGQNTVVIDEFYGQMAWALLLRLLDETPLDLPIKGGFTRFVARNVIFTSNRAPWEWGYNKDRDLAPLKRRIELVRTRPSQDDDWATVTWQ